MTPAERAVIDAARALEPVVEQMIRAAWKSGERYMVELGPFETFEAAADAFVTAVRALPRPLSEQLAELRPGAEVDAMAGGETGVLMRGEIMANRPERQEVWFQSGAYWAGIMPYRDIRRVISNPEADRG